MHLLVTFIAAVVLIGGIFVNQKIKNNVQDIRQPVVLSEEETATDNNLTTSPTPSIINDESIDGSNEDSLNVQNDEEDGNQQFDNLVIGKFIYPDSTVVHEDESNLQLASGEESDTITDWYKSKIELSNMNVKTFVKTNANNKVLNKLVATNGNFQIDIEINRETQGDAVKIEVNLSEHN